MYGIFTYIHKKTTIHVGKYTMHAWYGIDTIYSVHCIALTWLISPGISLVFGVPLDAKIVRWVDSSIDVDIRHPDQRKK